MTRVLPFSSKVGFGVGQLAEGVTLAVFGTFVLFFFNQVIGISGTLTGMALGIALFCDAITDPMAGSISDRLRTRWGRRRPFVLIGTPIYIAGIWLLFIPPIEFADVTLAGITFNSGYPWMLATLVANIHG